MEHRGLLWVLAAASLSRAELGEARTRQAEFETLVGTERAFAKASVTEGMTRAFARYFAAEGIQFIPHPVPFRRGAGAAPPADPAAPETQVLNWSPKLAGVSQSGDLGFTTGPYTLGRADPGEPDHGQFFSVWRRERDGKWQVVLDLGVKLPKPSAPLSSSRVEKLRLPPRPPDQPTLYEVRQSDVVSAREVESVRPRSLLTQKEALIDLWSETGRWYREGRPPLLGKAQVRAALLVRQGFTRLQPLAQAVSKASDLGLSYGRYAIESKERPEWGYYARLWRRDEQGSWRIALEVTRPLRP